jgi:hypothetical protein
LLTWRAGGFEELGILYADLQKNAQQSENFYLPLEIFNLLLKIFGSGYRFNEIGSERMLRGKA